MKSRKWQNAFQFLQFLQRLIFLSFEEIWAKEKVFKSHVHSHWWARALHPWEARHRHQVHCCTVQLWASYIACRVSVDTKLNFPLPWRFFGLMNITDKVLANTQWLEFCHFQWENIHKKCFFSNQTTPLLWVSFSLPTADPTQHGVKKGYETNELDKMHPSKWCSSHCLHFPGCGTVKKELGNCPFWWEEMAREKTCFSRSEDSQLGLLSTWEFFIPTFLFLFFKPANKNRIIANSY